MTTQTVTTKGQRRTAAATAARTRAKYQRMARELTAAGWTVTPPPEPVASTPSPGKDLPDPLV